MDPDGNEHPLSYIERDAIEGDAENDLALLASVKTQNAPITAIVDRTEASVSIAVAH